MDDPTSPAAPPAPKSKLIYWTIAILIAAASLYYALRGIDWHQVWNTLAQTRLEYIVFLLFVSTAALFLRALRWRVLLKSGGPVRISTVFWATCAGYFGNSFLPARAGELVRTMAIDAEAGLGRSFILTTALSERMVDAITLVLISSVVLLTLPVRPGWYGSAAKPFAIIGLCGVIGIAVLPKLERLWHGLLERAPVPDRFRGKLTHVLEQILFGLRAFHDWGRLFSFLALTGIIWFLDAVGAILAARSLGLDLNLAMAYLLITGLGLGSALPSTPGYVGIYQYVAVTVLTPFGFPQAGVIAYTLLMQAFQYLTTAVWGVFALLRFRKLKPRTSAEPAPAARI